MRLSKSPYAIIIIVLFFLSNKAYTNSFVKQNQLNPSLPLNIVVISKKDFIDYYNKNKHKKLLLQLSDENDNYSLIAYSDKWLNKSKYDFRSELKFQTGDKSPVNTASNKIFISNLKLTPKKLKLIYDELNKAVSKNSAADYYVKFIPQQYTDEASGLTYINYNIGISDNKTNSKLIDTKVVTSPDPSPPATNKKTL